MDVRGSLGLAPAPPDGHIMNHPSAAVPGVTMAMVMCEQVRSLRLHAGFMSLNQGGGIHPALSSLTQPRRVIVSNQVHLFGFDMDLPAEFATDFKHYYDNVTVCKFPYLVRCVKDEYGGFGQMTCG
jgi:hypothetical protein